MMENMKKVAFEIECVTALQSQNWFTIDADLVEIQGKFHKDFWLGGDTFPWKPGWSRINHRFSVWTALGDDDFCDLIGVIVNKNDAD